MNIMIIVIVSMDAKGFKKMRREKGYSQSQLAREFGVTVQTVSRWERAVVDIPRMADLALSTLKPRPKTKKGG
jgi:DNA-binding transcriptional regulator YiaG